MRIDNLFWLLILVSFSINLSSCDKINGDVFDDDALRSKLYNVSFDTLTIGFDRYSIAPYLYRNFFPGSVLNKKRPLVASIELVNVDSLLVLQSLEVKNLYIINSNLIWQSLPILNESSSSPEHRKRWVSVDGPEWDPGIYVDVVFEIMDKTTSTTFYLIKEQQLIERLD